MKLDKIKEAFMTLVSIIVVCGIILLILGFFYTLIHDIRNTNNADHYCKYTSVKQLSFEKEKICEERYNKSKDK